MKKLKGIIMGRCPRCGSGGMFKSGLAGLLFMNNECAKCGLNYLRESGYYLGAMYVSYGLGVFTVLPVATYLGAVAKWPLALVMTIMVVQTLVSVLLFLRFSRIIWLYVDEKLDPQEHLSQR